MVLGDVTKFAEIAQARLARNLSLLTDSCQTSAPKRRREKDGVYQNAWISLIKDNDYQGGSLPLQPLPKLHFLALHLGESGNFSK